MIPSICSKALLRSSERKFLINIRRDVHDIILRATTKIKEIKHFTAKPVEEETWDKKEIQLKKEKEP